MTEEGALLGTVGYMAPEQYLSQPVNAKTDQFAFSVALYDALYGQKPFEGRGVAELAAATVTGSVREPPKGSGVPAHVHRVLLRGLSAERDARYPSMHALLEDLQRDPAKERRRILGGVFGATLVVATVVFGVRAATARQGKLCSAATPLASEVWNDDVKSSIERSFAATGLPFAVDTWSRTRDQLDGYMTQWRRMHEDTCRATRIDGHQSEATMAIRMGCLEQRRDQVRALSHVLEQADRQTVERSVEAAKNLPNIEACADVTSLTTVKALPADGEKRKAIQDLYREVGDLRVRGDAGRYKDVTAAAPGVIERARATGYDPLVAEALYVLGDAQDHLGAKPDSATSLREAYYAAEAGRAEELKLKSLILLVSVLADQRKFEEARATSRLAAAASQRLPDPSAYDADLHSANAWVLCRDGKYDESAAEFQKGIAAAERASDAKPVKLARMYSRAGGMLGDGGRFDQAYDLLDRADATFIRVLGPDHPARATTAVNRTATLLDQGRATEALATVEAGLELGTRVLPQQSGTLANLENNRSVALHSLGRFEEARSAAAHAVEIGKSVAGPTSVTTAGYLITLGEALVGLGRWDEANATLDGVLAVIEPALPAGHEWLAEARAARAEARMGRGDAKGALPDLEKALVGYHGIDHKTFFARRNEAQVEAALAEALWGTGVRSPRVGDLVSAALTTFGDLHDEPRARALDTWARTHIAAGPGVSGRSR
jgi:tetratricopeptide (TPR) repeat protein